VTESAAGPAGWDFFVSYTQADRDWAEWIAWQLEEDGRRVLIQAWDMVPGTNWVQGMQEGVARADRTIAVLSPEYAASQYESAQWRAAFAGDPGGAQRKLLVVRVQDCERPGLLGQIVSTDLFGLSPDQARGALLAMVAGALAGRAKPAAAPPFPSRAMSQEPHFPEALPGVFRVPPRNPNFVGRDQALAALGASLAGGTATVHSVRGLGGVGKTQLAIEHAYDRAADYDLVFWIAAEEPGSIPDQFATLARLLGLDPVPEPEGLQAQVHDALRRGPGWLLIFDNAGTVAGIRPWLPRGPQPAGVPGHVIVTTRRGGFAALGPVLDLDVIDPPDALRLLRTRVPSLAEGTGAQIAEELGRLPLALEQAAAYLDKTAMPPAAYLAVLRQRAAEVMARGEVTGRADNAATAWDLSLEKIATVSPAAISLLDLCAYLAPERIPEDLFTAHPALLPGELSAAAADPLAFSDVVGVLVDYSMMKRTGEGLQVHRLIQGAVRARHAAAS
jgi:TIR domain